MRIQLFLITAFMAVAPAWAQSTVTIAPDADASIYSESNNANGSSAWIFTGANSALNLRRAMLRFPVDSVVPAGATITSVEFELEVIYSNQNNHTHDLHRLQASWAESSVGGMGSGSTGLIGDATWNWRRYLVDPWVTPGGDFVATPSATRVLANSGRQIFGSTPALVADVQGWVDAPSSNFGWILIGEESIMNAAYRIASREDSQNAPLLRITFDWPSIAAPYGFACAPFDLGTVGLPAVGNTSFALDISTPITASGQVIMFSVAPLTSPLLLLNCLLHLDPVGIFATVPTDPFGTLAIPLGTSAANLLGTQFWVQGGGVALSSGNLLLSNGLFLQIGN